MIANTHYGFCGGAVSTLEGNFTYTGSYNLRSDGVLELLTSGTFTPKKKMTIDVFLVGGGASGSWGRYTSASAVIAGGGGGGGYTSTVKNLTISTNINVTIGAGGAATNGPTVATGSTQTVLGNNGQKTSFGTYSANGGLAGSSASEGGNGGSGGGGSSYTSTTINGGAGGTDGSDGKTGYSTSTGGAGQGTTTREFGENTGKLYSGGGGGGSRTSSVALGGSGGGGNGALFGGAFEQTYATAGAANTGGGGGGGIGYPQTAPLNGGAGGSGIVCVRLSV